ncbi:MAG: HEAT repeat domain-containing protein [Deltaproteobacteria bacterium]|nr:HEAT repeat domain-containing protein [Deltaproteobacteria bacterium]
MDTGQLKNDIFDANHPERQLKAAYQMRYARNDPEIVHILFRACYEANRADLQQESVRSLGVLCPERAINAFIKSTENHVAEKRMRAYYHLGTLGNPGAIDVVLRGLNDPDEKVRRAAAVSAGRLGSDHRAINSLRRLLDPFEPIAVRSAASVSVDMIKKRMNGKRTFNDKRSFNRPAGNEKRNHKGFNRSTYVPDSYTPKGF